MYNKHIVEKERFSLDASTLFKKVKVKRVLGSLEQQIDDITTDSRTAREGSILSLQLDIL